MHAPQTINETISFFREHGARAVDIYPYAPCDPDNDDRVTDTTCSFLLTKSMMPVYVACLLGYSTPLIAKTIESAEIDIRYINRYAEVNGPDSHDLGDDIHMDPVEFAQRLIEGFCFAYKEQGWVERDLMRVLSDNHSCYSLGVMHLGLTGVNCHTLIDHELDSSIKYRPNGPAPQLDFECRAQHLSDVLLNIKQKRHLPYHSGTEFIRQSGAIHPAVLRKSFGWGFWESLINESTNTDNNALEGVLRDFVLSFPGEAEAVLKSLDFSTTDFDADMDILPAVLVILDSYLHQAGIGHVSDDVSFKLGCLTSHLSEDDRLTFGDEPSHIFGMLGSDSLIRHFMDLKDLGENLFAEFMESHMSLSPERISFSHFAAWKILDDFQPCKQVVSDKLMGRYLQHMAQAASTLFPKGHENIINYRQYMVLPVSGMMSKLVSGLGKKIDYSILRSMTEDEKDLLSQWGLSLRELGVKSASTIDNRIGSDLGL